MLPNDRQPVRGRDHVAGWGWGRRGRTHYGNRVSLSVQHTSHGLGLAPFIPEDAEGTGIDHHSSESLHFHDSTFAELFQAPSLGTERQQRLCAGLIRWHP
jgi:hypothetical protein